MNLNFKTTPYKHQLDYLTRFGGRTACALLAEMGTGKSWMAINDFAQLAREGNCDRVLILAPNGVHRNWSLIELPKHMPDDIRWHELSWSPKKSKSFTNAKAEFIKKRPGVLSVLTMNWEALQHNSGFEYAKQFVEGGENVMIVCDESDAIKNPTALRTKNLMALKPYSRYRRIMSGTPIASSPFDLFSQFRFLNTTILGTSYYSFKAAFAQMANDNSWVVKSVRDKIEAKTGKPSKQKIQIVEKIDGQPAYKNLDRLAAMIEPHSFRVRKKDCLDLPDKIYSTTVVQMTSEQQAAYDKAKDELRLIYEHEETPINKLAALSKLAQITSGYYLHPMAEEPVRIPGDNPKLEALVERVTAAVAGGEQVIVWARYTVQADDVYQALTKAGLRCGVYNGQTSSDDRVQLIDDFQANNVDVLVGNQQAGGTGITLTAATLVVYFSNDFSLRNRLQSEDRAHRIGQTKSVLYLDLVAEGTIDEAVVRALQHKTSVAKVVLDEGFGVL